MIVRQILWTGGLLIVAAVCCSCGNDSGVSSAGLTDSQKAAQAAARDPANLKQQGAGGVKARGGGGLVGPPEDAKPGEHVGPPPAGGKAGGG